MNAIEISNLNKSYEGFALRDINLTVPCGSIVGLVGSNGAGKSTTIKLIMNAIERKSGQIKVLGIDNTSPKFRDVKQDIGVVLDEAYFSETMTPKQANNIMKLTYKNWDEKQYYKYIDEFQLPVNKKFKEFSRGMKMKLAIAVALSHKPKLLILDEATSGLDPMIRDEMLDIFNDFTRNESNSILLSSHIVSDLEKICDYIAFIHNGELVFFEEKDRLHEEYAIIKLSEQELEAIPKEAIIKKRKKNYGIEVLVLRSKISEAFTVEHATLEDIIIFMAKEEK